VGVPGLILARYQTALTGGSCRRKGAFIMGGRSIQYYFHVYTPDTLPEWKAKILSQYHLEIWENVKVYWISELGGHWR